MKAIRVHTFGEPDVMKLEEVPDPRPGVGQVVVAVRAIGVNPVDTYIRAGRYGQREMPFTPGMDAAGVVEAVGEGVTKVRAGDRVYTAGTLSGSYAEKTLCKESQVHRLPDNITFQQGAGIYVPFATAYRALFNRAHARPGDVVLVHGASGGVGTAAVQIARAHGMVVIGTAGTDRGRELVREQGADHVLDHKSPGYLDEVMQLTGGRGVDVILEMLSNVNLGKDLKVLAKNGRVVVIGSRGTVEIDPRDTMSRDAAILGMTLMNADEEELASIAAALYAGMRDGLLRPIVGRELPLAEAPRAHRDIIEEPAYGKIVLIP
jgi:NADPH2:quinone reductase